MAQEIINVGTAPNDGLGDPIRTAYIKCNTNFGELFSRAQAEPPATLVGSIGDVAGMYAYDENYFYYCFQDYDGSSQIWNQITEVGNISITQISSGSSNVAITDISGEIAVSVSGTSNVAVFTTTGMETSANVDALNINATNLYGTVSTAAQPTITSVGTLTGLSVSGNANATTVNATTVSATTITSSGTISATGNVNGNNLIGSSVTSTGNIMALNGISAVGDITTTGVFIGTFQGNITGNFVVPGANTQVLFNTNGNADAVAGFTYNRDSNVLTLLGNVSAGNLIASANVNSGNLNVTTTASVVGNVIGGNINTAGQVSATANITGGNLITSGVAVVTGNVTGGNLLTNGLISAQGNVTGGNVIGGQLSAVGNITGGNVNLTGRISTTGNIIAGNVSTTLIQATTISATGNITGANLVATTDAFVTGNINVDVNADVDGNINALLNVVAQGNVSAVGNVNGGSFNAGGTITAISSITGGSFQTAATVSAAGNVTGGNLVTGGLISSTGTITSASNITGGNLLTSGLISATGNVTGGNLIVSGLASVASITKTGSNAVGNIGSSSNYFDTLFATATSALYADLAEKYLADAEYDPGTVLCFDGEAEVTQCDTAGSATVAGVVSTRPAYVMNNGLEGEHTVTLALIGRVPCKVVGPITRGAMLVSAGNGYAQSSSSPSMGTVIGKALENFSGDQGVIEIVVGRL